MFFVISFFFEKSAPQKKKKLYGQMDFGGSADGRFSAADDGLSYINSLF